MLHAILRQFCKPWCLFLCEMETPDLTLIFWHVRAKVFVLLWNKLAGRTGGVCFISYASQLSGSATQPAAEDKGYH